MKAGVVVFPGSNCDRDACVALEKIGASVTKLWHADTELPQLDLVVLPGGFSYGDYLRCGSISANASLMKEVKKHADQGRYVLGICNGFQVLTEAELLPGALIRNRDIKFICRDSHVLVENTGTGFTNKYKGGSTAILPVAHHDGNYFADSETIKSLEDNAQVAFRYSDIDGNVNDNTNFNGSINNIAGIFNSEKNVLGMMPHPERAVDSLTAGLDGTLLFESLARQIG